MSDITTVVDGHLAALGEGDAEAGARLVERAWTPDGHFVDPLLDVRGHEEIAAIADAVREHYPDHAFRRTSAVDVHHDRARFTWTLVGPDPDAQPALTGVDVALVADDGRLREVVGFFGDVAEAA